jgi:predicted ester cyclase
MQATHKEIFMGIPATGKRIMVKAVEIDKIVGGKIVEAWGSSDSQGMMAQLGVTTGAAPRT